MGRLFSTIYRSLFLAFSVSALVFSVLSATSCAFVKFDHQYQAQGRRLEEEPRRRSLAEDDAAGVAAGGDAAAAAPADTAPTVFAPDRVAALGGMAGFGDDAAPADTAPTMFAPGRTDGLDGMAGYEGDADAGASASSSDTPATVFAPGRMDGMGGMSGFEDNTGDSAGEAAPAAPAYYESTSSDTDTNTAGTVFAPDRMDGMGDMAGFEDNKGDSALNSDDTAAIGAAVDQDVVAVNSAVAAAAATASGDAGLYCDGDQIFSVTNLWGKSVEELAEELADASDRNQSEELARVAVVMASLFGALAAFVAMFTSLTGFRVCCERWILGLVALFACALQGLTFLFFNSERYCDGDIVSEILNQEPCVIGKGGLYSIVAMVLYGLVLLMACRLPQDDPFSPVCNKTNAAQNDANSRTFKGSENGGGVEMVSDDKPATAPWMSGEQGKKDKENEII